MAPFKLIITKPILNFVENDNNPESVLTNSSAVSECPSLPYPPKPQLKACICVLSFKLVDISVHLVILVHSNCVIWSTGDLLDVGHWKMSHLDAQ